MEVWNYDRIFRPLLKVFVTIDMTLTIYICLALHPIVGQQSFVHMIDSWLPFSIDTTLHPNSSILVIPATGTLPA